MWEIHEAVVILSQVSMFQTLKGFYLLASFQLSKSRSVETNSILFSSSEIKHYGNFSILKQTNIQFGNQLLSLDTNIENKRQEFGRGTKHYKETAAHANKGTKCFQCCTSQTQNNAFLFYNQNLRCFLGAWSITRKSQQRNLHIHHINTRSLTSQKLPNTNFKSHCNENQLKKAFRRTLLVD